MSRHASGVTYNVPPDPFPSTLNSGDVLNVSGPATPPGGFSTAPNSRVNVLSGGDLAALFTTGANVYFYPGSRVGLLGITGGSLFSDGGNLSGISNIGSGAYAEILGGEVKGFFGGMATIDFRGGNLSGIDYTGTTFNLFGGAILPGGTQFRDSVLNVRGGSIANGPTNGFGMERGEFHFYMRNALLNGAPIPGLVMGGTATIPGRNVTLSGQLENGTALNYVIRARNALVGISTQTTVKVTLVPESACQSLVFVACTMLSVGWRKSKFRF